MTEIRIHVDLSRQCLTLWRAGTAVQQWPVSTARNGPGERLGSECTPRGEHVVLERIGEGLPAGAVLVGRRPTGERHDPQLAAAHPGRDWILSRILWLGGCEPGRNLGGAVDTRRRYIYIHGCPDGTPVGVPGSRGCIRMRNADVIALFDLTPVGTRVLIDDSGLSTASPPAR